VRDVTAITDPRVDTVLQGRYRILARIAAGGMGVVYRAERVELERPVAIKFLHPWIAADQDFKRRFEIEVKAMSRLAHPCCVSFIDFGEDQGAPYVVMDLLTGDTLRMAIREGPMEPARALRIAKQILAGLAHAHDQGITHRDIKPDNILLTEMVGVGEQVRILDFGVAKLSDAATAVTFGTPIGTPAYMAPEQIQGQPVDARTDVYATGLVLFELLTTRRPFESQDSTELFRQQMEEPPPPLGTALEDAEFSPQLEAAVARALEKSPRRRFQSAREFADALALTPEARGQLGEPARTPTPPSALPAIVRNITQRITRLLPRHMSRRSLSRARPRWIAGALGVSAVAAAAVFFASRPSPPPEPAATSSAPSPPVAEVAPEEVAGVDEAYRLGVAGRVDSALNALRRIEKTNPNSAYVVFTAGRVQFANYRWNDGLASFREAIQKNPRYRADGRLIRDVIRCLDSDRAHFRCEQFLAEDVGLAAVPYLEDASRSHPLLNVQVRAAKLATRLRGSRAAAP
jgi:serine/threonine-protein kinase